MNSNKLNGATSLMIMLKRSITIFIMFLIMAGLVSEMVYQISKKALITVVFFKVVLIMPYNGRYFKKKMKPMSRNKHHESHGDEQYFLEIFHSL